ncbi:MAG TPA: acyltransferase family protein [Stellaceae bacterium]|nr:acyltransferase family protein [Stellaceae bacterium]
MSEVLTHRQGRTSNPVRPLYFRTDIDGLRAVAIVLVVLYHAFPALCPGGFIGVDVFFVISGYLITSILLREIEQGHFSVLQFYARRFRRIVPALFVVMLSVWGIGWLILLPDELKSLGRHIIDGAGFVSNMLLLHETGYFDAPADSKPLLHLWSLAIEEQYYIIWPLLLLLMRRVSGRHLGWSLATLFIASFALGLGLDKDEAFYLMPARFWELLVGGILAYWPSMRVGGGGTAPAIARWAQGRLSGLRNGAACAGLAALIVAAYTLNGQSSFPKWAALMPTLGAAALIAAGDEAWLNRKLLASPPFVKLGLISYPLYLWHWPLICLAHIDFGIKLKPIHIVVAVLLSLLLAAATYLFIETPIRTRPFFASSSARLRGWSYVGSGFAALGVLGLLGFQTAVAHRGFPERFINADAAIWDTYDSTEAHMPSPKANASGDYCGGDLKDQGISCIATRRNPTIALIGDSHASHLLPGFIDADQDRRGFLLISHGGCPPAQNLEIFYPRNFHCLSYNQTVIRVLRRNPQIKTVIVSATSAYINDKDKNSPFSSDRAPDVITSPVYSGSRQELYRLGIEASLRELQAMGLKIIWIVDDPELTFDPNHCIDRNPFRPVTITVADPKCSMPEAQYQEHAQVYFELLKTLQNDFRNMLVFDATDLYCRNGKCSPWYRGHSLYRDPDHLSYYGSRAFAERFFPWLEAHNL